MVIVIIAIAAAAIAPRFSRDDSRRAETSALAVREVFSAAAARAELTGSRVALVYDPAARALKLMEYRWSGAAADWTAPGRWTEDGLVPPATLDGAEFTSVRADAFEADPASWTVEFAPGARRPSITAVVTQTGGGRAWRIDLPGGSMRAEISDAASPSPSSAAAADLDATGRQEDPW